MEDSLKNSSPPPVALVAGGTGFIGKELVKTLNQMGFQIVVLNQKGVLNPSFFNFPVTVWPVKQLQEALQKHACVSSEEQKKTSCTKPEALPLPLNLSAFFKDSPFKALQGTKVIFNLAGAGIANQRWTRAYKRILWDSRIKTTKALVSLARVLSPQLEVFVSTSAVGFYGNQKEGALTETAPCGKGFLSQLSHQWEKELTPLHSIPFLRSVVFRLGMVLSPKGGALAEMKTLFKKLKVATPLGKGTQYVSWIDLRDLISLYVFSLKHPLKGVYNAVSPKPVTHKELIQSLALKEKIKLLPLHVPAWGLKLLKGEQAQIMLDSVKVSCQKIQKEGFQFRFSTLRKSLTEL